MMKVWEEYKFKIQAYTPDTLPMERFASYLRELALMLGESSYVHFVRLEPGSTVIVHKVDKEAVPKIRERTIAVKRGQGTVTEMRSYRQLNNLLREDNATGVLTGDNDAEIIQFPGKDEERTRFTSIQQHGEIDGEVIRVGGSKDIVPILLQVEGKEISHCYANRTLAKELAKNLFEPVRLYGEGRWERSDEGIWSLIHFDVNRFEVLKEISLSQTVIALRGLQGEWGEDALHEILRSRHADEEAH